jgi:lipid-A-disaccharide synthase
MFCLEPQSEVIALLPGSRSSEIHRHAELFIQTAVHVSKLRPETEFIISAVNSEASAFIHEILKRYDSGLSIQVITRNVRQVISASDLVLAASGTVTLETALLGKPMVVAYRVSKISEWMVRLFSNVSHYAMPNFLLDKPLIPEFVQNQATAENLSGALSGFMNDDQLRDKVTLQFRHIKEKLKVDSNKISARVVRGYLESKQ